MKICIFCSSSNHIADFYRQSAFRLGKFLADSGHVLIYGGATGGLMDAVAEGATEGKGQIVGVIPPAIIKMKRLSKLPTQLIEVEDMSERKKRMKQESDAFVALPGGFGTLDEMFDVIASGMVGEHRKPLICINENGFYNNLLSQIDTIKTGCFAPKYELYAPVFVDTVDECMKMIDNWRE